MGHRLPVALYRTVVHELKSLANVQHQTLSKHVENHTVLKVRVPLSRDEIGHFSMVRTRKETLLSCISELFPNPINGKLRVLAQEAPLADGLLLPSVLNSVKDLFRESSEPISEDLCFECIKIVGAQKTLAQNSSATVTKAEDGDDFILIEASSSGGVYRIYVENLHYEKSCQLLGRHWIIRAQDGTVISEVPKGSRGVVGFTPVLQPGAACEYYSYVPLTQDGTMEGSFQMIDRSLDQPFDALIQSFPIERFDS